jgi:CelD/BcsL family acetyltransferase involved in cellulose biosynthesis
MTTTAALGGALTFDRVTTLEELEGLADGWDALVLAAPRPSPFMLHAWLVEWWREYGDGASLAIHVARRDGRLVGALPLCTRRRGLFRVTEFVGGGASALGDVLLATGETDSTACALVDAASHDAGDFVDLFGLPGGSVLERVAPPHSMKLIERVEAPVLDLTTGWDAVYRAKTDSKKRNLHKRRRRQLSEQGQELKVVRARTLDELLPALESAFTLHELRWEGRPDGSGFATSAGRRFNRAVVEALAPRGIPRIVSLELDGRTIAFHYYFALAGRMYVYRLAFDPAFARFSPGLVNTLDALEAASDEGLDTVEYLGGDERYKLELSDRLEPLHQGLGLTRTPHGTLAVEARLANVRLRRRLKRSPAVHRFYLEGLAPARRLARRLRRPLADS